MENACGLRRGLALVNVTAWSMARTTESAEAWLKRELGPRPTNTGERYDEDRFALPAVQAATVTNVQCAPVPCQSSVSFFPCQRAVRRPPL